MARYEHDPSAVQSTMQVFPKGDYEFSVGEPKPFERTNAANKLSYGVGFSLKCERVVEGEDNMLGKRAYFSCYQHTEGGCSFSKRFQMSCLGHKGNPQGENAFNDEVAGQNWGFDPDEGTVGDMWSNLTGNRLVISMSEGVNPNTGDPSQNFDAFRPVD